MGAMKKRFLFLLWLRILLDLQSSLAQTVFNNASQLNMASDNTGDPSFQPGTEVLNSFPGLGVNLASGGSYEHVGQFYVAINGLWNQAASSDPSLVGTDYFGYAPPGIGTNTAYLGKGIQGASPNNGGHGFGQPIFGTLQLNSTGEFPVEGGMKITHSLRFNANGPGGSCIITTPNSHDPYSSINTVVFVHTATISGANEHNYIQGYASVTGVEQTFTLPLGDANNGVNYYCPLTIVPPLNNPLTARYRHINMHPTAQLESGIGSVSFIGNWPISAPTGARVTIKLPPLNLSSVDITTLRLVGWTGDQWVNLSQQSNAVSFIPSSLYLSGTILNKIYELGIGSTSRTLFSDPKRETAQLVIWPNPTQGILNLALSNNDIIEAVSIVDQQGRVVVRPYQPMSSLNTSSLLAGSYILEVSTSQGQTFRKPFIKQP